MRTRKKVKNIILETVSIFMVVLFVLGASSIDSAFDNDSLVIPIVMMVISGLWLLLFGIAND